MFSYFYHPLYALRVALSIRASKCDIVIVHNFLQFASIIKLFNPSVKICLSMHCEWLTQFATPASECRLRKVDLIIGRSDYITEKISARFPAVAGRCHTVYDGVDRTTSARCGIFPHGATEPSVCCTLDEYHRKRGSTF
jgi:spore coat protein SA